jgi:hypothetical protein
MNHINLGGFFASFTGLLLVAFFCIGGCGGGEDGHNDEIRRDIIVTLLNDPSNTEPIHILSPGENIGPDNRLLPGESRDVFIGSVEDDEVILFRAGRLGQICETAQCIPFITGGGPDAEFFLVTWQEPDPGLDFFLDCEEGFQGNLGNFGMAVCPLEPL